MTPLLIFSPTLELNLDCVFRAEIFFPVVRPSPVLILFALIYIFFVFFKRKAKMSLSHLGNNLFFNKKGELETLPKLFTQADALVDLHHCHILRPSFFILYSELENTRGCSILGEKL